MWLDRGNICSRCILVLKDDTTYLEIMLVSLTVGKVDAGVAVLLTEDKRLVGPS